MGTVSSPRAQVLERSQVVASRVRFCCLRGQQVEIGSAHRVHDRFRVRQSPISARRGCCCCCGCRLPRLMVLAHFGRTILGRSRSISHSSPTSTAIRRPRGSCGHCWRWAVILIWRSSPRVSSCRNRRRCCARSGASSSRASFTRTRHRPPDLMTYSVHPWARGGRKVVPGTAARRRIAVVLVRCGGCVAGWPLHRVGGDVRVRSGVAPGGEMVAGVCWSGWSCGIGWSPDAGLTGSCRPVNW